MTIPEFQNRINLSELIAEFFSPENRLKNALNNNQFKDFANEAFRLFVDNETSIIKNFFENIQSGLDYEDYAGLSKNLSILIFDPFTKNHVNEFRKIYKLINSKIIQSNLNPDLLIFYWTILDHNYHGEIFDKFDTELSEAKKILIGTEKITDEKNLLLQKIGHHYGL